MKQTWIAVGLLFCSGFVFAQTEQKLTASDAAAFDEFGWSVSIDRDTAVVGAIGNEIRSGAVYIFVRDDGNGNWSEQARLTASDAAADDEFGHSVSVSGDTVVIGSAFDE